eukprot:3455321-Pyramimonas_sp.AAC.1
MCGMPSAVSCANLRIFSCPSFRASIEPGRSVSQEAEVDSVRFLHKLTRSVSTSSSGAQK